MIVSHTYLTAMSQEKPQALAALVEKLSVLTPKRIKDTLRTVEMERLPDSQFELTGLKSYVNHHHALRVYNPIEIRGRIARFKPDVVCIEQEPFSISTWQIMRLKKEFGFKVAIVSNQNLHKKYPPPFRWIENYCLKHTDLFFGVTGSVLPVWLEKGLHPSKAFVLPQVGVNPRQFDVTQNVSKPSAKFAFGYAGRFVEEKGVHVLIDAFARFDYREECELVLYGRGPYESDLRRQVGNLGVTDSVKFVDGVKHHEMPAALAKLDVLVLPSLVRPHWKEQFGHIIIEAMSCGVPVLGSDCDPIPEVIGDGGMAFKEGDADSLAIKMNEIYSNAELRRRLAENARARVLAEFTNEVVADRMLEHFERILRS